jgi:transposase
MGRGRPKAKLVVSPSERATLERWTMRHKTAQALACRARIVLLSARGMTNNAVAEKLDVSRQMVCKWRARFVEKRLDGILDEPRPGRPRQVGDAEIERVIVRTLESTPRDATHWSVRSMAKAKGITPTTIHRIWRAFSLQPHRTETFKLSKDPLFIRKCSPRPVWRRGAHCFNVVSHIDRVIERRGQGGRHGSRAGNDS